MSEAARSRRDEARYEPQMAAPGREAVSSDPLAELARLVGQDDPFRNVFRPAATPMRPGRGEADAEHGFDEGGQDDRHLDQMSSHGVPGDHAAFSAEGTHDAEDPAEHHAVQDHGHYAGDVDHHPHAADDDAYYAAEQRAHPDEAGMADEHLAPGYEPAILPDVWARGAAPAPDVDRGGAADQAFRSSARQPVAVLAAVLVLTGGGLAAAFLAKGPGAPGAAAVSASRNAPTIMAATGPTKVKIDDPSATAPEDRDAALLNKNAGASSGPAKIVSSEEQPADLAQLPKSDLAEGARPLPPPSGSPYPEPKKVKTFLVHPDGSMLSGDGAPPTSGSAARAAPAPAAGGDAPAQAPLPATPKTESKGGTTPKSAPPPASIATLAMDPAFADAPPAPAPTHAKPARQPASPGARVATVAKPNDTAESPGSGGSYGAQLASLPTEAEAHAAFAKLKKKYPTQLGAYSATVHKAETGDKPVYRVRIVGMSQDDAKALCSQLQSVGGPCYVVHN